MSGPRGSDHLRPVMPNATTIRRGCDNDQGAHSLHANSRGAHTLTRATLETGAIWPEGGVS